jgi:hypothetical protein
MHLSFVYNKMQTSWLSDQVSYHDAFLGTIQTSGRVLEPIRFPLVTR